MDASDDQYFSKGVAFGCRPEFGDIMSIMDQGLAMVKADTDLWTELCAKYPGVTCDDPSAPISLPMKLHSRHTLFLEHPLFLAWKQIGHRTITLTVMHWLDLMWNLHVWFAPRWMRNAPLCRCHGDQFGHLSSLMTCQMRLAIPRLTLDWDSRKVGSIAQWAQG
jgi:hypothetical protein